MTTKYVARSFNHIGLKGMCTESLASDVTHVHMRVSFTVSHLNVFSCCKLKVYIAARSHASLGKLININNHTPCSQPDVCTYICVPGGLINNVPIALQLFLSIPAIPSMDTLLSICPSHILC